VNKTCSLIHQYELTSSKETDLFLRRWLKKIPAVMER